MLCAALLYKTYLSKKGSFVFIIHKQSQNKQFYLKTGCLYTFEKNNILKYILNRVAFAHSEEFSLLETVDVAVDKGSEAFPKMSRLHRNMLQIIIKIWRLYCYDNYLLLTQTFMINRALRNCILLSKLRQLSRYGHS